jgi:hypothetical protein
MTRRDPAVAVVGADTFGLRDRIRFGTEIVSARFEGGRWILRTGAGAQDPRWTS